MAEFDGLRATLYEEAITQYPNARREDIETMYRLLQPKTGDTILGIGEGNGYFCKDIATAIGRCGRYVVTDPSEDQLDNLIQRVRLPQVEVLKAGAEEINQTGFDKVWSFGGFHHCTNQTAAMKNIYSALKPGGIAAICDVFQGTTLADHFDEQVARYCETGHEVKFLSDRFAKTLGSTAGFRNIEIVELPINWCFESEEAVGDFMYKLHAMTKLPGTIPEQKLQTLEGCKRILGLRKERNAYLLNWPMKAFVATR